MNLTVNIATRGRPEILRKTLEVTLPNVSRDDTTVMVAVDDDDQPTIDMFKSTPFCRKVLVSIKKREDSRGEKYDRALTEAPADLYLPAVDHAPIVTPGFDQALLDKAALFPDGIGCIRTPFINRGTFPPALQAVTAKLVDKLGYIYNPEYPFWFIDHELHDFARLIGRYFLANISVAAGVMRPGTTWRLRDVAFWATYYDMMALERRAKARAIILGKDFLTPDWIKKDLIDNFEGIENEARLINDGVRRNAASIERDRGDPNPPDEGYLRAKERAEAKLSAFLNQLKAA